MQHHEAVNRTWGSVDHLSEYNLHGRDILSFSGVLGKITIKEYTYKKTYMQFLIWILKLDFILSKVVLFICFYCLAFLLQSKCLLTKQKKQELANQKCRPPWP